MVPSVFRSEKSPPPASRNHSDQQQRRQSHDVGHRLGNHTPYPQEQLADAAGLSRGAIRQLEAGASDARTSTMWAVQSALEKAGVEFTNGGEPGVKLRASRKVKGRHA
jgi:transcriptional regulator with XRE-family HTH domain